MRIEYRDGHVRLVDDVGTEVRRGDPLIVGRRVCFFDHVETRVKVQDPILMLSDEPGLAPWDRMVSATADELGRLLRVTPCVRAPMPSRW